MKKPRQSSYPMLAEERKELARESRAVLLTVRPTTPMKPTGRRFYKVERWDSAESPR